MVLQCCALYCSEKHITGQKRTVSFHSFPKDQSRRDLWAKMLKRANFVPTNHSRICSKHFTEDCFDRQKLGGIWLKASAVPTIFDIDVIPKNSLSAPKFTRKKAVDESLCADATCNDAGIDKVLDEVNEVIVPADAEPRTSQEKEFVTFASQALALEGVVNDTSEASEKSLCVETPKRYSGVKRAATGSTSWSTPKRRPVTESPARSLRYIGDYTPSTVQSPSKARAFISLVKTKIASKNALLKRMDMKNRRLKKRVASLKAICNELKKKVLLSGPTSDHLSQR